MLKRTLVGLGLLASFVGVITLSYFLAKEIVEVFILLWTIFAAYEMTHSFKRSGYKVRKIPIILFTLFTYPIIKIVEKVLNKQSADVISVIMLIVCVFISMAEYTFSKDEELELKDFMSTIFILVYPLFMLHLIFILMQKYNFIFVIVTCVTIPIFSDAFAYYFGASFGKKKICPRVSPKKTIAGAIGALVGGLGISVLMYLMFILYADKVLSRCIDKEMLKNLAPFISKAHKGWEWQNALIFMFMGTLITIVSQLGDLVASKIKRLIGIKDYGHIFPEHGGVMDRLDSIISSCIVLTIFLTVLGAITTV